MKRNICSLIMFFLLMNFFYPLQLISADAPVTTAGSGTVYTGAAFSVPLTVTNFSRITAIFLRLDFNPLMMSYSGFSDLNSSLTRVIINEATVSSSLHKIIIGWSGPTPLTLANGTKLADLKFTLLSGSPTLSFNNKDNSGSDCEYNDANGNPMNDSPSAAYYFNAIITNNIVGQVNTIKGAASVLTGFNIDGTFTYNNTANTPLDYVKVILKLSGNATDSTTTNLLGQYHFEGKQPATYTISAATNKPWGGVNGTDAVKIQRHFVGLELLTIPVRLLAADVNLSNSINGTDAVKIKRRFSALDTSFARGNWTFAKPTGGDTADVVDADLIVDFQGLCVGDVNGNLIPSLTQELPTITTAGITSITQNSATGGGNVFSDGGASVTARGVCWSTSSNPTTANDHTSDGSGTGNFISNIAGLILNTLYYVKAYATNSVGTAYGSQVSFTTLIEAAACPGIPIVLYDGITYNTVQIGTQCWFRENLNIGTRIDGNVDQSNNSTIEKYCWGDLESNCDVYGGLYQWAEVVQYLNGASNTDSWSPPPSGDVQGICPPGWHVPTDAEWCTLTLYLDPAVYCDSINESGINAGSKMKEAGTVHWAPPNAGATNESGLTALPGGFYGGIFSGLTNNAHFWSSSEYSATHSWKRYLDDRETVSRNSNLKNNGFSVRCIKDCTPISSPASGSHVSSPTQIIWNWSTVSGATGYKWNTTNDYASATDMGTATTKTETGLTCNTTYIRYAWAYSACGHSAPVTLTQTTSLDPPSTPASGIHVPSLTQIIWNWSTVSGATGYKWNTINDYALATDMGTATTKTETGLTCNTSYTRYAWAYNGCGYSTPVSLTQTTSDCSGCGSSLIINHVAGSVAPVDKTVTYGTVTNVPGEPAKCWITSNLGADHQATAVNDSTEASAGWYWQFNRKQGYKHDGTTRTPNDTWIIIINENSNWLAANDPCVLEIGNGWRLPTKTEWVNVNGSTGGNWTNWNGPFSSLLKMHAAGNLNSTNGSLQLRGGTGYYWSSNMYTGLPTMAYLLWFNSTNCAVSGTSSKSFGNTLRCIKE